MNEDSPKIELSIDERIEYTQLCEGYRHDDKLIYRSFSVLIPLSFGAIAIAVELPQTRLALTIFSIAIYCFWLLMSVRLSWFTAVRLSRARELELKAGLNHFTLLKEPSQQLKKKFGSKLSIRLLRWCFLFILIISWAIVYILSFSST